MLLIKMRRSIAVVVVVVILGMSVIMLLSSGIRVNAKQRRTVDNYPLTADEIRAIVDLHNSLRGQENASDMNFLRWDPKLADMAREWAKRCDLEQGGHDDHHVNDSSTRFYGNIGHIVGISERPFQPLDAIREWYEEKLHYHYDINACDIHFSCGKYTQLVWATTQNVGCGRSFCPTIKDYDGKRADKRFLFICNYGPSGNVANKKPFRKGSPCSQCSSGILTCYRGLCREDCHKDEIECTCEARCGNCAKTDSFLCQCVCEKGWMGPDCSEPCRDGHENCGFSPGFPSYVCKITSHEWDFVRDTCPAMCGSCQVSESIPKCFSSQCDARKCHHGATFDAESCKCLCPKELTGQYCNLPLVEHLAGAILKIRGPIHRWTTVWRYLSMLMSRQINSFCKDSKNYGLCCTTSEAPKPGHHDQVYMTDMNVMHGMNYPVLDPANSDIYHLLVYADYWPENTVCHTKTNPGKVPQEVVVRILKDSASLVERLIKRSCVKCSLVNILQGHLPEALEMNKGIRLGYRLLQTIVIYLISHLIS